MINKKILVEIKFLTCVTYRSYPQVHILDLNTMLIAILKQRQIVLK